jgi:hypothetical protein
VTNSLNDGTSILDTFQRAEDTEPISRASVEDALRVIRLTQSKYVDPSYRALAVLARERDMAPRIAKRRWYRRPDGISAVLQEAGLIGTEADFAAALKDALAFYAPLRDPKSTENSLSEAQIQSLVEGGLDMSPLTADEATRETLELAGSYALVFANSWTASEAASQLGTTEDAIRSLVGRRELYGFGPDAELLIPRFQFTDSGGVVPGLSEVLQNMPLESLHPVAVWRWFTQVTDEIVEAHPISPISWLAVGGDPERLVEIAKTLLIS